MKKLFLLSMLFVSSLFYSQECGTADPQDYQKYDPVPNTPNTSSYCVNVYFRIVRDDDGKNGYDAANNIPQIVSSLNQFYNPHNITIINAGYNFINHTGFNQNTVYSFNDFPAVPNAINVYLVTAANDAGISYGGRIIVKKTSLTGGIQAKIAHELGHSLNLLHTFHCTYPYNASCAENPNGSNCATAGDGFCDTPADYYNPSTTPYSLSLYHPDMTNIMSYWPNRDHFTASQGNRMRNAINSSPNLQPFRSNACASITGIDKICPTVSSVYTLANHVPGSAILWSVSSNLQIVGSTTSPTVTVQGANASSFGTATITAVVGGSVITKSIYIGVPSFESFTCGPLSRDFCSGAPVEIESNVLLPVLDVNDKVIANFIGLTAAEASVNANWQWQTLNTKITLAGNLGQRRLGLSAYGATGLQVRAKNSCGWSAWYTLNFELVEVPSSGKTAPLSALSIFSINPNPTSDFIYINLKSQIETYKNTRNATAVLYDLLRLPKAKITLTDNKGIIDVRGLSKGIYIVKITVDEIEESYQVLVK